MSLNGFSTASDLSVSSVRHCSSASTSAPDPRTRCKARLASSILPRCIRLLAVSGTSSVPVVMINAGTAARPSESRQPQPWILAVSSRHTDAYEELEAGNERAAPFWWRRLGEIKWGSRARRSGLGGRSTYLVREADSDTKQDATDYEHDHIDRGAVNGGAGEEGCATEHHTGSAPERPSDSAGSQRTDQAGYVEGGGEGSEELAVIHAVFVLLGLPHPPQHGRKKPPQERLHCRHAP
ncbi:hypothetical protein EJ110_NYTH01856 [Nymphaea thermarum]|nr:hypothetical protein EJ110_NYTH01856 [Nymphaea thermarum]